jgi:hypothetical protein
MNRTIARLVHWVSLPVVAGALGYLVMRDPAARELWQEVMGGPMIDFPAAIELGEQNWGKEVRARFLIANRGRRQLVLDQFRLSCACASLQLESFVRWTPQEPLRIAPGAEEWMEMRINIRAQIGAPFRTAAYFRTNDPTRPEAAIEFLISNVTGGISAIPTSLAFGDVALGADASRVLEIRDTSARPRAMKRVASSNPDQFRVRLLPGVKATGPPSKEMPTIFLGRIEVLLKTSEPGAIAGHVLIDLDDPSGTQDKVRVTARVVPLLEAFPSCVVLPRSSSKGPIYFMDCLCRSPMGKRLALRPTDIPPGVSVEIASVPDNPSQQIARISFRPDTANPAVADLDQSVRFRALVGDMETTLAIPVRVHLHAGSFR